MALIEIRRKRVENKQVTRGHNIVADGWAGVANPHPQPTPHPIPTPSQTPAQKASKTLVLPLLDSCSRTNGPTDKASFRAASPQLKRGSTNQPTNQWMDKAECRVA